MAYYYIWYNYSTISTMCFIVQSSTICYISTQTTAYTLSYFNIILLFLSRKILWHQRLFSLWKSNLLKCWYFQTWTMWTQSLQTLNIHQSPCANSEVLTINRIQMVVEASCNDFIATIVTFMFELKQYLKIICTVSKKAK